MTLHSLLGTEGDSNTFGSRKQTFDGGCASRPEDEVRMCGQLWVFQELHKLGRASLEIFRILESMLRLREQPDAYDHLSFDVFAEIKVQARLLMCACADLVVAMRSGEVFVLEALDKFPDLNDPNVIQIMEWNKDFCDSMAAVVLRVNDLISFECPICRLMEKSNGNYSGDAEYFAGDTLEEVSRGVEKIVESLRELNFQWSKFVGQS